MKAGMVIALAGALVFGRLSAADLSITFNAKSKVMMSSAKSGTEIHYYSATRQLTKGVDTGQDQLVDYQQGISYLIDHKKKTIEKISFDDAAAALDSLNQASGGGKGMMASLFGDPNDCKVEKTGVEQVAGRTCQGWHITVGKLAMDLSADPTLKLPMQDAAYARMVRTRAAQFAKAGPMGATYKRLFEEMAKIKGVPLKTHMSGLMGMDVATEAVKIETIPIPANTFNLPEGYKVEDLGKKLQEQLAKQ